jgi:hypothetical protein
MRREYGMEFTVDSSNVSVHSALQWSAEASELGFPVGRFPTSLSTTLGNGQKFLFEKITHGGNVAVYKQEFGAVRLSVFNT